MPIPSFVSFSGAAGTNAVDPGLPADILTDDILILTIEGEGEDTNADSPPTGGDWTAIDGATGSVASATDGVPDRTRNSTYWHRYSSGSPPSTSVPDAGNHTLAVITAWRGCVTGSSPIHQNQSSSSATNDTSISATGVTTTADDCLIVIISTAGDGDNSAYPGTPQVSGWTNANLASPSITEAVDVTTNAGSDGGIAIAYGGLASNGDSGTTTATISTSEEEANWVIALEGVASSDQAVSGSDTASWNEATTETFSTSRSDTASWTETAVLTFETQTDTASWSEAAVETATANPSDTASWNERRTELRIPIDGFSSWAESEDLNTGEVDVSDSDTASWTETSTLTATYSRSDTGAWDDTESEIVQVDEDETASWTETSTETATANPSETGAWTTAIEEAAAYGQSDTGGGDEGQGQAATVASSDTGSWAESETLVADNDANLAVSDTAGWSERRTELRIPIDGFSAWADTESLNVGGDATPTSSDTAAWTETTSLTATSSATDTASWDDDETEIVQVTEEETAAWTETVTETAIYGENDTGSWAESESLDAGGDATPTSSDTGAWFETPTQRLFIDDPGTEATTVNLNTHLANLPMGASWEYGATGSDWQVEGAVGIASNSATAVFARLDTNTVPIVGPFTLRATQNQAAIDNLSWGGGLHFFCDSVGAADSTTQTGVRVAIEHGAAPSAPNIVVERYNDAGASQESFTVVTGVAGWSVGDAIDLGCDVHANGLTIDVWTEPAGGGARTQRGTVTLTADIRDANHQRLGVFGGGGGSSGRNFTTNILLLDETLVQIETALTGTDTASWAESAVLFQDQDLAASDTGSWLETESLNVGGDATPSDSDTAAWIEALLESVALGPDTDTGAWQESQGQTAVPGGEDDTGAWSEAATLTTVNTPTASDTGGWSESISALAIATTDTASWSESETRDDGLPTFTGKAHGTASISVRVDATASIGVT